MDERRFFRFGAAAGLIGGILGLIFNVLHPRFEDFTARTELEAVAESGIWLFDHYMIAWSLAFGLIGLVAVARSMSRAAEGGWAWLALAAGVGGVLVTYVTVAVDGMATKTAADAWTGASGEGSAGALAGAEAVVTIGQALFTATIGSLFGLTPVLYGIAILATGSYPSWTGWLAAAAGGLGLLAASIQYLSGPSTLTVVGLFTPASLLFTVWALIVNWMLWQRAGAPRAAEV